MTAPLPCSERPTLTAGQTWKHGPVPVIGLIGGIGGGKSRVAELLARSGARVIDADAVGHAVLEAPEARARIVDRFGPAILKQDFNDAGDRPQSGASASAQRDGPAGRPIDRRALGRIVFQDRAALHALEAIVHPLMRARFLEIIAEETRAGTAWGVVLDAAVLLEAGWDDLCDRVVFVDAPRAQRLERVTRERGWSEADLQARESAQWPVEDKAKRADWSINNDGDLEQLGQEVRSLIGRLRPRPQTGASAPGPAAQAPTFARPERPASNPAPVDLTLL